MGRARLITLIAALAVAVPAVPAAATAAGAPGITTVSPAYGTTRGGTAVTLTGTHFEHVHAVRFGGTTAQFRRVSSTELRAITPAHPAGWVTVAVVTANGTARDKGGYSYAKPASRPV